MRKCQLCKKTFQSLGYASHRASCVRKNTVRDERSEESAEKLLANASPEHIVTVVGMAATEEGSWFTESSYKKAVEYVSDWKEEILQAERTRIIKALEGLKKPGYCEEWKRIGGCNCGYSGSHDRDYDHNQALDQAIKAVGERSESAANEG